jgi:4-aminobutyrate aminotransferase/(S)-3-amino-2-methylpropionate transaminase
VCAQEALAAMERIGPERIAALVVEPVQGEGGVIVPGAGFLPSLADYCRRHGIVVVADEVQAGFGRTGTWFASEHFGLVPDIVTTAKGLGGGLPIGGVTARAELVDSVHVGGLGTTFGGNPLSCVAALAAIEEIEAGGLLERARSIGQTLLTRFRALQPAHPALGDVRGLGAMVAIEFVRNPDTREPDPEAASEVLRRAHAEGLVLLKAGSFDNVVRVLPPLTMPDDLLDEGIGIVEKAVRNL